ncbi:hypothetical protein [Marinifilum caeruleilacunae]|uniref:DUF4369 domain-containing protein n=1 Tax=Marinifilum caeruleilacunae TaxID=2499076 RepID=A0ABX1X0U7_9BACT|nr:hypothetical protein [Marinifilum caeruleilacunae]NOU62040.1 hypothetical protein [Marinifilum caeruleilacunae]
MNKIFILIIYILAYSHCFSQSQKTQCEDSVFLSYNVEEDEYWTNKSKQSVIKKGIIRLSKYEIRDSLTGMYKTSLTNGNEVNVDNHIFGIYLINLDFRNEAFLMKCMEDSTFFERDMKQSKLHDLIYKQKDYSIEIQTFLQNRKLEKLSMPKE